jgi:hypothetical protein
MVLDQSALAQWDKSLGWLQAAVSSPVALAQESYSRTSTSRLQLVYYSYWSATSAQPTVLNWPKSPRIG